MTEHHPESDEQSQRAQRLEKLQVLHKQGIAYPNDFKPTHFCQAVLDTLNSATEQTLAPVYVAGRLMRRRLMGRAAFVHIQDMSAPLQIYLKEDELKEQYADFKQWDIGDIIGVVGTPFRTKTDEPSLKATSVRLLAKSLHPLPDKYHGLQNTELCYRQRYIDLMMNEKSRQTFKTRSQAIQLIRQYLDARAFLEVETPMMHPVPGGAAAKPFVTHHNALDRTLYLRIAPELYLKRLVVGGFERVFEINRNFRNEGLSTRHNPEFTMIEFYQAYADYHDFMDLIEDLIKSLVQALTPSLQLSYGDKILDFTSAFKRMSLKEAIVHYTELEAHSVDAKEALARFAKTHALKIQNDWEIGHYQLAIFEALVEDQLQQPHYITQFPIAVSPLARASDADPLYADRAELFIAGREIANLFSELNDPLDQARRFEAQMREKDAGNDEAMHFDVDYVQALEYGLPPTAGAGIGIDRLVMLLTDAPAIRDVLLFPQMRELPPNKKIGTILEVETPHVIG